MMSCNKQEHLKFLKMTWVILSLFKLISGSLSAKLEKRMQFNSIVGGLEGGCQSHAHCTPRVYACDPHLALSGLLLQTFPCASVHGVDLGG